MIRTLLRKADTVQRRTRRALHRRWHTCDDPTPVFVVGCQRSGTSMTMRVFDLSLDATVFQEANPRAFDDQLLREPAVIKELISGSRTAVAVFKPMNQLQRSPEYLDTYAGLKVVLLRTASGLR